MLIKYLGNFFELKSFLSNFAFHMLYINIIKVYIKIKRTKRQSFLLFVSLGSLTK